MGRKLGIINRRRGDTKKLLFRLVGCSRNNHVEKAREVFYSRKIISIVVLLIFPLFTAIRSHAIDVRPSRNAATELESSLFQLLALLLFRDII